MNIAICDDDKEIITQIENYIKSYTKNNIFDYSVDAYYSGEDFVNSNKKYDIVFMDIYMKELTGVDALRQTDKDNAKSIVFMTTSKDFAIEAFNLGAVHYLIKPIKEDDVHIALARSINKNKSSIEPMFKASVGSSIVAIPYSKLIYIESLNKRTIIHTSEKNISNYTPLDTIQEELDSNQFMRAQRSFIVNMANISDFHYDYITLDSGEKITLSRNTQSDLKKQYQDYLFNLARRK